MQQKRTVRILNDSGFLDHTEPIFKQLKLLKFLDIFKFFTLVEMYKRVGRGMFRVGHSVNTRNKTAAHTSFHRLTTTQQAFSYIGPTLWNNLPIGLRQIPTIASFKCRLREHLIGQYQTWIVRKNSRKRRFVLVSCITHVVHYLI